MSIPNIHIWHNSLLEVWLTLWAWNFVVRKFSFPFRHLHLYGFPLFIWYIPYCFAQNGPQVLVFVFLAYTIFIYLPLGVWFSCRVRTSWAGRACKPTRWHCSPLNIMDASSIQTMRRAFIDIWSFCFWPHLDKTQIWETGRNCMFTCWRPQGYIGTGSLFSSCSWQIDYPLRLVGHSTPYKQETSRVMGQEEAT